MELMKVADRKRKIYEQLKDPKTKTVVLYGKPGVGKTWTAREVSRVARRKSLFDIILWVYLNREYDDDTLSDCIAQQLSLLPTHGVCEVEEDDEEAKKEEVLKREGLLKKLRKKSLLLVLDDEGNKMEEPKIRGMLNNLLKLNLQTYKVLVTTRNDPTKVVITTTDDPTNMSDGRIAFKVEPMVREESLSLLKQRAFSDHQVEGINTLAEDFLKRTEYMPNAIVMMAKAFKYFSDEKKGGAMLLRRSLEEPSDSKIYDITDLLRSGYDLVPHSILIDCQRDANEKPFFNDARCINHNELIAYWMMEGYLGPVSCMETAYRKGHEILIELLDFQVLKRVEGDYVTLDPLREEFNDFLLRRANNYYRHGYYANARLGLDSVFGSVDWKGLVRISHKGGLMRTLPTSKEGEKVSALLLDGNSLTKDLSKFITALKDLHVLAIFNPTVDILSPFLDDILKKIHVFVLRSCHFMKNMDQIYRIEKFENLTILEISGSSSLAEFPEKFFERTPKLQSLNLSSLPVTSLPLSLYNLDELKWLILRDCTLLKSLESLRKCKSLVVLDCSGSTSLEAIRDARFVNEELLIINLSNTKMKLLPLVGNLRKLTHLLLSKCSMLNRLRNISNMASLEVIDLSNSGQFSEFNNQSIEELGHLKIVDLSGTAVTTIPGNAGNPRHLCLENCTKLNDEGVLECLTKATAIEHFAISNAGILSLPPISHLTNLRQLLVIRCVDLKAVPDLSSLEKMEVLNFSGCKNVKSIPDGTFDKMSRLQELNLSGTSIESLPSLANLSNLRCLLLKDCKELKTLPYIESKSLEKLEEMNVSGGKALRNVDENFFDGTVNLHILDLSDAPLDKLPSFSSLVNLRELHLRNCNGLKRVPNLESLTGLEILDLSESSVSDLPSLSNLSKLRQLMLRNCSGLSSFREMGTLSVLGARVQDLPYGISGLPSLEYLDLPCVDATQGADEKERKTEGDVSYEKSDGCEWGISSLSGEVALSKNRPSVSVRGTQFLESLAKVPKLWESSLKKFHLSVYPINELDAKSVAHFQGDYFVYRDIYVRSKRFTECNDQQLLEVYGFTGYKPQGIEEVFSHANQFSFIDNKFQLRNKQGETIQTWPSFIAACNSEQINGCWIESCREIEVIFRENEIDKILALLNSVRTLWVSNAKSLKSICGKIPKDILVFQNLKTLYLECCPNLPIVLSLSQLPQKLKTLHIKFCDKLSKVFDMASQGTILQCLETLHLWELPELESIGCRLPSLKTLKVANCPKLQNLEETIRLAESLQNLSITNVRELKTIGISKRLKYLSIDSCPELVEITSAQPPSDLGIRIRFCNKLETLFQETLSEFKLEKLHLHGLPNLRNVGARLPNQANCFICDCLNL